MSWHRNYAKFCEKKSQNGRNQGFSYYFCLILEDPDPDPMQLHTGAEHFGNVIFQYGQLTSKYHIDAWIDVNYMQRGRDKTMYSVTKQNSRLTEQLWKLNSNNPHK